LFPRTGEGKQKRETTWAFAQGEENMSKKLSDDDKKVIEAKRKNFQIVASGFEIETKEVGDYIHVLRDKKIIGSFKKEQGDDDSLVFEFHNSYPDLRIKLDVLNDDLIKDVILRTPGN